MNTRNKKSGSSLVLSFIAKSPAVKKIKSLAAKHVGEGTKLKIGSVDKIGTVRSASQIEVKFGSVTVEVYGLKSTEVQRNIKDGQVALSRATNKIIKPGVIIEVTESVPLFHADPTQPGQIVRVLNGKKESGVFVNGKFITRR